MPFDRLIPFGELIKGDPRHDWYGGGVTTDWLQEQLLEMRVSPAIPKAVAHQLSIAKQLCVVGWFCWDLYASAIHYATVAGEVALRHRWVETLPLPVVLLPRSKKQVKPWLLEQRPEPATLVEHLRGWRLKGFRDEFRGGFKQLVEWGLANGVIPRVDLHGWEAVVELRNVFAHGSETIVPTNNALTVLERTIWMLNSVFPDPETAAYDAPRRKAADEEIESMFRSVHETLDDND